MAVNDFLKSRHGRKKVLKKSMDLKVAVIRWPLYAIMGVHYFLDKMTKFSSLKLRNHLTRKMSWSVEAQNS